MREFFFVEECPCAEECTQAAWKRASVWGWTHEKAKAQLVLHLVNSGHHEMTEEDAANLAEMVELKSSSCKRRRVGAQEPIGQEGSAANALPPAPVLAIPRGPSSSSPGLVTVRIGELQAISDAVGRATTAARQAQRVAAAAATAFSDEATVLADAKAAVDRLIPK